jgi:hypothetical protein
MAAVEECVLPVVLDLDVKEALIRVAAERGMSMNDVAVGELAAEWDISYEPTGRAGSEPRVAEAGVMQLRRIPLALRDKIESEKRRLPAGSKSEPRSARAVIDRVLRRRLGL